jgi:hypothetical protein
MEETLNTIGIQTKLLHSKSVFNREETQEIFGCKHQTLKSFEKRNWISPRKFKNRNFYTDNDIIQCIKTQFSLSSDKQWQDMW